MQSKEIKAFEQSSPGRRLAMLHRLGMAHMAGPLGELGISRGQIGFLLSVLQDPGIIQEDLSQKLCIDRAATARTLQNLEREGWVRREEAPDDRRKKRVHPTDKARAAQTGLLALLTRNNEVLFAGLSDTEREQFLSMLDRLVDNARNAVGACQS